MLRRILVGLDGSPLGETILATVRTLAGRLGAGMTLLHVTQVPGAVAALGPDAALDRIVADEGQRARAYLEGVAQRLGADGLAVHTAVGAGEPAAEIVRHAEREGIDLIALATHGRTGVQRWLHGSVADAVLHTTMTPLLLLHPSAAGSPPPGDVRRLVVPLDGSPAAEAAIPIAEDLARALGVPVVLLRVVEPMDLAFGTDPFGSAYVDQTRILDALRESAERYLAKVAADLRSKRITVETVAPVGFPADTIAADARQHPGSLLVLSTHGRTGWRAVGFGSVARRVVLTAEGPVLVVRRPAR